MKKYAWFVVAVLGFGIMGCDVDQAATPRSNVKQAKADVEVQASGLTVEQENVKRRLEVENMPGAIKHLYVISAYSGQVIMYSTVKGKVTSSGKRLVPATVSYYGEYASQGEVIPVYAAGGNRVTADVPNDDGTWGSSIDYLYWWDVQGRYHQHYVSGGQIVHVADQPIAVKSVTINMEVVK